MTIPLFTVTKPGWVHAASKSASLPALWSASRRAFAALHRLSRIAACRRGGGRAFAGRPAAHSSATRCLSSTMTRSAHAWSVVNTSSWCVWSPGPCLLSPSAVHRTDRASRSSPVADAQHLKTPSHTGRAITSHSQHTCSSVSCGAAACGAWCRHAAHSAAIPWRFCGPTASPLSMTFCSRFCSGTGTAGCRVRAAADCMDWRYCSRVYPMYRCGQCACGSSGFHALGTVKRCAAYVRATCRVLSLVMGMGSPRDSVSGRHTATASAAPAAHCGWPW